MTVLAAHNWKSNAHLIADVAQLGYLDGIVLDATFGEGNFWTEWQPKVLITNDLFKDAHYQFDFRHMRTFFSQFFDAVVFDPPYKLSGTPALGDFDNRYGIDVPTRWQDRWQMCLDGITECGRVAKTHLLVKCQDQVCSGKIRWQTLEFPAHAASLGYELIDRFDFLGGGRPQPSGRRQVHAHGRPSTLLVLRRS